MWMKSFVWLCLCLVFVGSVLGAYSVVFQTEGGDIIINSSIIKGSYINWSDILNAPAGFADTDNFWALQALWFSNVSGVLTFDEVQLNSTIMNITDARDDAGGASSDNFWPLDGLWLTNNSGTATFNEVMNNATIMNITDARDDVDDAISSCVNVNGCTIDAESMEGTDWGTLTDAKWCVYDSASTEVDCNVEPVSDTDTTYSNGTGLNLSGTEFSLMASFMLPQGCGNGQIAEYSSTGIWQCGTDDVIACSRK